MTNLWYLGKIADGTDVGSNGWRRDSVWAGTVEASDEALCEFTAYYEKPGTEWQASCTYYVREVVTENLPDKESAFVVDEMTHVWRIDPDGDAMPGEDYEYGYGDVRYFRTYQSAEHRARELALIDESSYFL
jgi:hypothetical protein